MNTFKTNSLNTNADERSTHTGSLTLVLGGVRSGKSRFAQDLATQLGGDNVLFVATAESRDGEMARRINHHRQFRPSTWQTLEQPFQTARAIAEFIDLPTVVLVDCLTLLVSNIMCADDTAPDNRDAFDEEAIQSRVLTEVDALIDVATSRATNLIIVSGEVGSGVVPDHPLGRMFRDLLGMANRRIAQSAAATYWMLAGLAINANAIASTVDQASRQIEAIRFQETQR